MFRQRLYRDRGDMYLAELIAALKNFNPDTKVPYGFHNPHSWRYSYEELAFEPVRDTTAGAMLKCAESAVDTDYQGYKGGTYTMHESCEVYLARRGEIGERLSIPTLLWMLSNDTEAVLKIQLDYIKEVWGTAP
jgi:hypothetical protein